MKSAKISEPPCHVHTSRILVSFICFLGTPLPHPLRTSYMEAPLHRVVRRMLAPRKTALFRSGNSPSCNGAFNWRFSFGLISGFSAKKERRKEVPRYLHVSSLARPPLRKVIFARGNLRACIFWLWHQTTLNVLPLPSSFASLPLNPANVATNVMYGSRDSAAAVAVSGIISMISSQPLLLLRLLFSSLFRFLPCLPACG